MKIRDARTISHNELEERRMQAIMLHKKGMKKGEIAKLVGVHRNTLGQWIAKWEVGGLRNLKVRKSGRPKGSGRSLNKARELGIQRMIVDKDPAQLKMDFALWSRQAVRNLIRRETGMDMPIRTVGEYLNRWGYTPQRPVRRAYERCHASVRRWVDDVYPGIAEKARQEGAEIHWGDETGLSGHGTEGRGFAPKGRTPVLRTKGKPERINMISTVTNQGKVRFMFYKTTLNAAVFLLFLGRLLKDARGRKLFIIVDNLRVHHARVVRDWVEARSDFIEIFYLPSYCPDLNPDEFLNGDLKGEIGRRPDGRSKGRLAANAMSAMQRIQKSPGRVRKYFDAMGIQYAR